VGLLYRAVDLDTVMPLDDFAKAAEERGFDSLYLGEHTHIPVSRETAFIAGDELPDTYPRLLDPYIALAFVAAKTSLRIGTGISLIAEHDPIALAKAVATLDHLSKGRFTLGVGFGWNREEFANHGHDYKDRRAIVRDYIGLMRSLWYETEAEYHSVHANLERSWSWPKPVQSPIPVIFGAAGGGDRAIEEVVLWADGWMVGGGNTRWLAGRMAVLNERWVEAGRSGAPSTSALQEVVDDETFRAQLDRLQELGVAEVICDIPTMSQERILPILDGLAAVIATRAGRSGARSPQRRKTLVSAVRDRC
jgi:probable F420-dependent oxidoreductase